MIYCSVKYCCSNSSIPGVILHSIMKSFKIPNHPAYHWSTLWPLEVWVRGLYNSRWFCVHKLSMFIYLSMGPGHWTVGHNTEIPCLSFFGITKHCLPSDPVSCDIHTSQGILVNSISLFTCTAVSGWNEDKNGPTRTEFDYI